MDRPDEVRRIVNFKRLVLTDFKIDIPRLAKKKVLSAALEESGVHLRLCLGLSCPLIQSYMALIAVHHSQVSVYGLDKPCGVDISPHI